MWFGVIRKVLPETREYLVMPDNTEGPNGRTVPHWSLELDSSMPAELAPRSRGKATDAEINRVKKKLNMSEEVTLRAKDKEIAYVFLSPPIARVSFLSFSLSPSPLPLHHFLSFRPPPPFVLFLFSLLSFFYLFYFSLRSNLKKARQKDKLLSARNLKKKLQEQERSFTSDFLLAQDGHKKAEERWKIAEANYAKEATRRDRTVASLSDKLNASNEDLLQTSMGMEKLRSSMRRLCFNWPS